MRKALTSEAVEKHLADFGLDAETASHTSIMSLSGGQLRLVIIVRQTSVLGGEGLPALFYVQ